MRFITVHDGQIFTTAASDSPPTRTFVTGLRAIDQLLPSGAFTRGAIHELLFHPRHPAPRFFALLLAQAAGGNIVWCDPSRTLYPPAVAAAGIPLEKLFLLRPANSADQTWAIAQCLRCKGVGATVAHVARLSRIEARRLQLAAEQGGGAGLLLRPVDRSASIYAAASRWIIGPMPGRLTLQRWKIQLIHARGGRIGQTVILEHCRETRSVRALEQLADRQTATTPAARRASA